MTYVFRAKDGSEIERDFQGAAPEAIRIRRKLYRKERICAPAIHAYTPVGEALHKQEARHYRQNKEVAEGIASGTMREPDDRGIGGDKQPRESKRQFNDMLDSAKKGLTVG